MMRRILWVVGLSSLLAGCGQGSMGSGRVELAVTDEGFEPAKVAVVAGKPVTLVVTRKTDKTCATELVLKDYEIRQELPLNQAVEITFTPREAGEIRYACGMDMIAGTIVAR